MCIIHMDVIPDRLSFSADILQKLPWRGYATPEIARNYTKQ